MTTPDIPSEADKSCERQLNSCDFCINLSRVAMTNTLLESGVSAATARNIATNSIFENDILASCDVNRRLAAESGVTEATKWIDKRNKSFGNVIGGQGDEAEVDIGSLTELNADKSRVRFLEALANDSSPLTKEKLQAYAKIHNQNIDRIMERMDWLGWPSEEDRESVTWKETRVFADENALVRFAEFVTSEVKSEGPNNLMDRVRPGSNAANSKYVERARLVAPDLYAAIVEAVRDIEGVGYSPVFELIAKDREGAAVMFMENYRRLYMLFGRMMRSEDVRAKDNDISQELWS